MGDLISRSALLAHECEADRMGAMLVVGKGYILDAPAVDAVEVVRCKDCRRYINTKIICADGIEREANYFCERLGRVAGLNPDDYCSRGEREGTMTK